jgi:acetyl-CoA acyltransferase
MTKQVQDVYIVSAVRTAVGKAPRGIFMNTRPDDLLAHVLRGAVDKVPSLDPTLIDDVIVGCAMPEAEQGFNVARIGVLLAGLPASVPGVTVNRFCSSGLQTIAMAAERIATGSDDVIIAAGTESMSMVKFLPDRLQANPRFFQSEALVGINYGMGLTAEKVAEQWKITREMQDEFAYRSHQKALAAIAAGESKEQILPYEVVSRRPDLKTGQVKVTARWADTDEGPRADSTLEVLAKLRPVFKSNGSVTAGNSSQMSDGAGALMLVSEKILKQHNLTPLAKFSGFNVAGVPPEIMGIGPKEAVPKVLRQTGLSLADMQWIELNEAFAAQSLAVIQDLEMNPEVINPVGGAIALGHPLGATGAIKATMLIHGMRARQQKYGMVTMCIGTGMGAAGIFEMIK